MRTLLICHLTKLFKLTPPAKHQKVDLNHCKTTLICIYRILTAIPMAIWDSVTVSIGDETTGPFNVIFFVNADVRSWNKDSCYWIKPFQIIPKSFQTYLTGNNTTSSWHLSQSNFTGWNHVFQILSEMKVSLQASRSDNLPDEAKKNPSGIKFLI